MIINTILKDRNLYTGSRFYVYNKKANIMDLIDGYTVDKENYVLLTREKIKEQSKNEILYITETLYENIKKFKILEGRYIFKEDNKYHGIYVEGNVRKEITSDNILDVIVMLADHKDNYMYYLNNSKLKYSFHENVDPKRELSCWYGGKVLDIEYKGNTITIETKGKTKLILYSIKDGKLIEIKDDNNKGLLKSNLPIYINSDIKLYSIINSDYGNPLYIGSMPETNRWQVKVNNRIYHMKNTEERTLTQVVAYILYNIDRLISN